MWIAVLFYVLTGTNVNVTDLDRMEITNKSVFLTEEACRLGVATANANLALDPSYEFRVVQDCTLESRS